MHAKFQLAYQIKVIDNTSFSQLLKRVYHFSNSKSA